MSQSTSTTATPEEGIKISTLERSGIIAFLDHAKLKLTRGKASELWEERYWFSYPKWGMGGRGWNVLGLGGTYIIRSLMWYHHIHRPGSKEWRPSIILKALLEASAQAEPNRPVLQEQLMDVA